LTAGEFKFAVYDAEGRVVSTATNAEDGSIVFPIRVINEPGAYSGYIKEVSGDGDGWDTDGAVYPYTIIVRNATERRLVAEIIFPDGEPSFTNDYSTHGASIRIVAKTKAIDGTLTAGQFAFTAYDSEGRVIATATNAADGTIVFPVQVFNHPGTYSGVLKETAGAWGSWKSDGAAYPFTIVVKDDGTGTGQLIAQIIFPNGEPVFANTDYASPPNPPPKPKPCKKCCKCCCRCCRCVCACKKKKRCKRKG